MLKFVVMFEHEDYPDRTCYIAKYRQPGGMWLEKDFDYASHFDSADEARQAGLQIAKVSLDEIDHPLWHAKFRLILDQVMPYGPRGSYTFDAALIRDMTMKVCELYDREPLNPNHDPECHEPVWDVVRPARSTDYLTYKGILKQ